MAYSDLFFPYADIAVSEGDAIYNFSEEGPKVKRVFIINNLNQFDLDQTGTLWAAYQQGALNPVGNPSFALPTRGTPHPTISQWTNAWSNYMATGGYFSQSNCFCADVFTFSNITPNQCRLTVEYSIFNAENQEPSTLGNTAPALLTCASSVQQAATAVDIAGQPIVFPYEGIQGLKGAYDITTTIKIPFVPTIFPSSGPPAVPYQPGSPSVKATANAQVPNTILRFHRRETQPRSPDGLVGYLNLNAWNIAGLNAPPNMQNPMQTGVTYPPTQILCTRIENTTKDKGLSYVVTYEFAVGRMIPAPSNKNGIGVGLSYELVLPAQAYTDPSSNQFISSWLITGLYVLPSGSGNWNYSEDLPPNYPTTGTPPAVQPGQTPPDALPFIYAVNGFADFNGILSLT